MHYRGLWCIFQGNMTDNKEDRGPLDLTKQIEDSMERIKELENSLSIALEINESHQRYNGKLQTRVTDLEEDNKKLTKQINDHIKKYEDAFRKAGL